MIQINYTDELYPKKLLNIPDYPKKLFIKGNEKLLESIGIAVIGTRNPSEYGKRMCRVFTRELVKYGVTIVSGMALGIDAIAHKTCLENGGNTIAVLPNGFNHIYPYKNKKLLNNILNYGGTAVTEYLPEEEPESKKFLERNRIVSGLSIGTLVIEAGYRSGTSVTARLTKEQGRKVFVVPSSLDNRMGITCNEIIRDGGYLVTCVEDILGEFPEIKFIKKEHLEKNVDDEFRELYNIIEENPIHINTLAKKLDKSISEINSELMMLELEDFIVALPGNYYIRK